MNKGLVFYAMLIAVPLLLSLARISEHGWHRIYILHVGLAFMTITAALFRRYLPYGVRACVLPGICLASGTIGMSVFGLVGGGLITLTAFAVMTAITLGIRAGLIACVIDLAIIAVVGVAVCTGAITFSFDISAYATSVTAWGLVFGSFLLFVPAVVIGLGVVHESLVVSLGNLQESHAQHERLVDNLIDTFLYRHDREGVFTYVSSSVTQVLGYCPSVFLSHCSEYLTDHPVNQAALRHTEESLDERQSMPREIQVFHRDGGVHWLEVSEAPVRDETGRVIAYEGIAHDITQRKGMERALVESEHRYRSLYTSTSEGMALHQIVYDESGRAQDYRIVDVNPAYESITGICRHIAVGKKASELYGTGTAPYLDIYSRVAESNEPLNFETTFEAMDKTFRIAAFSPERGKFATFFSDITTHKRAQEQLLDYQERLRSLASELSLAEERERRKMAGYLHDGPCQQLAVCLLKLDSLSTVPQTAQGAHVTEIGRLIKETVHDLRELTFDLSSPTLYLVGLEAALEELVKEKLYNGYGIRYDFDWAGICPLLSEDLRALLYQAVCELFNNIIKYAQANKVTVKTCQHGSEVKVVVEDDGIGFDVDRVGYGVSKSGGFGLFNMRERITYIGGDLDIWSQPGQGSRFTITVSLEKQRECVED